MLLRIVDVNRRIQLIGLVIVGSLPIVHFAKGGARLVADRLVRAGLGVRVWPVAVHPTASLLPTIT